MTEIRYSVMKGRILMQPLLPVAGYRLEFTALEPVRLPVYAGSAWRGVFGHALKRLVCVTRAPRCPNCPA